MERRTMKAAPDGAGWRVTGDQGWGVGVDFPSELDARIVASVIEEASAGEGVAALPIRDANGNTVGRWNLVEVEA